MSPSKTEQEDILSEDVFKSYNLWVSLKSGSSNLALSPGSHKLKVKMTKISSFSHSNKQFGSQERKGPLPLEFKVMMDKGTANFAVLSGRLAEAGTLVIFNLRLAHGATQSTKDDKRISFDTRFRVRVKDDRDIVFGKGDPPHWAICEQKWSKKCFSDHPHITHQVKTMLLVNNRLKCTGKIYLFPDLLDIIFVHLSAMATPRWIKKPVPVFPRFNSLCFLILCSLISLSLDPFVE